MPKAAQPSIFCIRLKAAREAADLSQKRLGIAIGLDEFVASTRINRYELGVHEPDLGTLTRMAKALDVPLAYFYAENDALAEMIMLFEKLSTAKRRTLLAQMKPEAKAG